MTDREALELAIETLRADPDYQIDSMLKTRPWQEVAEFAVGILQVKNLRLRPWECPPVDTVDTQTPANVYGFRASEVALLRRMLAAGLSKYEPDPIKAIERAERGHAA